MRRNPRKPISFPSILRRHMRAQCGVSAFPADPRIVQLFALHDGLRCWRHLSGSAPPVRHGFAQTIDPLTPLIDKGPTPFTARPRYVDKALDDRLEVSSDAARYCPWRA